MEVPELPDEGEALSISSLLQVAIYSTVISVTGSVPSEGIRALEESTSPSLRAAVGRTSSTEYDLKILPELPFLRVPEE